jgi:hypothetical protein
MEPSIDPPPTSIRIRRGNIVIKRTVIELS